MCRAMIEVCTQKMYRGVYKYTSIQLSGTGTVTEEYPGVMRSLYTGGNVDGDGAWG